MSNMKQFTDMELSVLHGIRQQKYLKNGQNYNHNLIICELL